MSNIKNQDEIKGKPFKYEEMIGWQDGSIVSRTLIDQKTGSVTLFAFDEGQKLSEHTASFDALVEVVDGEFLIAIDGQEQQVGAGFKIIMPANVPHALKAVEKSKMVLVMIRS
jgi:quercetin dioxygenase-like cupin family protein